jgi:Yip1 domain
MAEENLAPETPGGLGQIARVVDTFVAPSATFTDILRSTSWWLPFLLSAVVTLAFAYTVDRQVGFAQVAENQVHLSPSMEERLSSLTPSDRADQMQAATTRTRYFTYGFPVATLILAALASLVLWATFKFGLGSSASYGQIFSLWIFANLPRLFTALVAIMTLSFGNSAETFNMSNPAGTNLAYYLPDTAPWLQAFLGYFDIVGLWVLFLLILGGAIVARVKIAQAAAVVIGWWLLLLLVTVAATAAFS